MKIWGNLPGAGGPRAGVVVSNEGHIEGTVIEVLAVRQPTGIYLVVLSDFLLALPRRPHRKARRLFGEGGTEEERVRLGAAGYKIAWRGPAAKPKYCPTGERGG